MIVNWCQLLRLGEGREEGRERERERRVTQKDRFLEIKVMTRWPSIILAASMGLFRTFLLAVPIGGFFAQNIATMAHVHGRSMQPTLNPHIDEFEETKRRAGVGSGRDRLLLDRFSIKYMRDWERGQVVVLASPEQPGVNLVKRILALPGDTIMSRSGIPVQIGPGHCWVEGDNPDNSRDSNAFGPVPLALVESHAIAVVWPPSRMASLQLNVPGRSRLIVRREDRMDP